MHDFSLSRARENCEKAINSGFAFNAQSLTLEFISDLLPVFVYYGKWQSDTVSFPPSQFKLGFGFMEKATVVQIKGELRVGIFP